MFDFVNPMGLFLYAVAWTLLVLVTKVQKLGEDKYQHEDDDRQWRGPHES